MKKYLLYVDYLHWLNILFGTESCVSIVSLIFPEGWFCSTMISLIPWMRFRPVNMVTVNIFFSDIEILCVVVKGSSLSEN